MLSRPGKLNLLAKELGNVDISTFKQRKILQKTIYILSQLGLGFNYNYTWYIHGPYSPALADDAYELANNREYYDEEIKNYRFKKAAQGIINKFNRLFADRKDDEEWLELIASLLFLRENYRQHGEDLANLLIRKKAKFARKENLVKKAVKFIEKHF